MSSLPLLPARVRRAAAGVLAGAALAAAAAAPAHAAEKVTPDVTGRQDVLVVGCRFADTTSPDILNDANDGIRRILTHTHDYFDYVSNHRVDLESDFAGWHDLAKSSGDYGKDGADATKDCQDVAGGVLADRGRQATDYRDVVLLFNRDLGFGSATGVGDGRAGSWTRLRFSGGTGGGWTSEALWAHELSHAFGLLHSTFPTREADNQYNDFQDVMSGFSQADQRRWNFLAGGVCNGIAGHPRCIYSGEADQVPVHMGALQKQRLGWLDADQVATHLGGTRTYPLSAPTYNPNHEPTVEKLKLLEVPLPRSTDYYAIEYRRGNNDGDASDQAAFRRGWDTYEKGIRSDRVTVYLVRPSLHGLKDDLGDANLMAVLAPGERYTPPAGARWPDLTVNFDSVDQNSHLNASVTVTTPHPEPPTTVLSAAGRDGTWANEDVTARLFALPNPVGTPIATTYYGVDDRGCSEQTRDCAIYDGTPFTIAGEGEHDVTYFSSDATGGVETAQHTTVRIDKTAPVTAPSIATAGGGVQLTLAATDALSGVQETDYDLDGAGFKPYSGPVTIATPGPHTARIRSVDNAANAETPQTLSLTVPGSPIALTATASPARIAKADGRAVKVHAALRTDASAPTVRLTKVTRSGGGRVEGWTTGTADVDGKVFAIRGATYRLTYTVTDADGRTAQDTAKVVVTG